MCWQARSPPPNPRNFAHLATNRGLMAEGQYLRSKAHLPKAARVCHAKSGNVVTRVLSTASVRRAGRFPALPYPPRGRLNLLQEFVACVVLVLSATVLVLVLETIAETTPHCYPPTTRSLSALDRLRGVLVSDHEIALRNKTAAASRRRLRVAFGFRSKSAAPYSTRCSRRMAIFCRPG